MADENRLFYGEVSIVRNHYKENFKIRRLCASRLFRTEEELSKDIGARLHKLFNPIDEVPAELEEQWREIYMPRDEKSGCSKCEKCGHSVDSSEDESDAEEDFLEWGTYFKYYTPTTKFDINEICDAVYDYNSGISANYRVLTLKPPPPQDSN